MTRSEVLDMLSVLKAAYPNFYRGMSRSEADGVVSLWCTMFADEPVELVAPAVKALIATDVKGFPPHIGAVKAKIQQISTPKEMTEMEAWGLVKNALRNGYYGAQEEFDAFPPDVQKTVGSPNQLKEWALMDTDTLNSVVASNFQRSYRARAAQNREFAALPADIKAMISGVADRMALVEGSEE